MSKSYLSKVTRRTIRRAYRDLNLVGVPLSPSNEQPSDQTRYDIEQRIRDLQEQIDELTKRIETLEPLQAESEATYA